MQTDVRSCQVVPSRISCGQQTSTINCSSVSCQTTSVIGIRNSVGVQTDGIELSICLNNVLYVLLAWQTWDLLRIYVFGVKGLVGDFLKRHPGYFLVLSRINGSAVESLFSQIKYSSAGKLSSSNYATARKSVMITANVENLSTDHSYRTYRNEKLSAQYNMQIHNTQILLNKCTK